MQNKFLFILLSLIFNTISFSQINFTRDTTVSVFENSTQLKHAWNGGVNSAQFSEIDLDLDGTNDLIIFDRSGNRISPYLNVNGNFVFSPEYRNSFPSIESWLILNDYNCDGKQDIFTYQNAGIAVYTNTSSSSLSFTLATSSITNTTSGQGIYVSPMDLPAISDIDNDGDLDILTFEISGGFVHYFKNESIENHGNCDYLEYSHNNGCWGNFYEGLNTYILDCFNCLCPPITIGSSSRYGKHAGSTLIAMDVDGDMDKDLILGDVSYTNLNLLINGGTPQSAHIIMVDTAFPQNITNTIPADIHIFPSAFYIDATHDGTKDLIVTTNMQNNSANKESCWIYENSGTNSTPNFNFIQKDFLQGGGVDLGENAHPTFYDENGDGLLDLFVGNYGYHSSTGTPISKIAFYKNTGTIQNPEFTLISDDFLGLSTIPLNTILNRPALNLHPTFGDLNGDFIDDLIIGDADGKIHLFTGDGTTFNINIPNFDSIDVGYFASPQIIDVNRDGLNDLIIGSKSGQISYFENKGTPTNPDFSVEYIKWGGIDVDSLYISNGFSSPKLIEINDEYHLFIGSYTGKTYLYNNIDGNINGIFSELNTINNIVWEGGKNSVAVSDINNDSLMDIIIGNQSGGLAFFKGDTTTTTQIEEIREYFNIYPNPSSHTIYVKNKKQEKIFIYNSLGELVFNTKEEYINVEEFPVGIYVIKKGKETSQFIKK